jgi:hypothetical protein
MTNKELAIAASTIWVAPNGGTHGSPVDPLLRVVDASAAPGLPPGKARLRPQTSATEPSEGRAA